MAVVFIQGCKPNQLGLPRSQEIVSHPGWPKEKILGFKWPKTAEMKFLFFSRIFLNMIRDFLVWQTIFADIFFLLGFFNENLEKKGSIQNETMYKLL